MNHNKHSTPILAAVRAMHAAEDATGYDPYNAHVRRHVDPVAPPSGGAKVASAERLLASYGPSLSLREENDK